MPSPSPSPSPRRVRRAPVFEVVRVQLRRHGKTLRTWYFPGDLTFEIQTVGPVEGGVWHVDGLLVSARFYRSRPARRVVFALAGLRSVIERAWQRNREPAPPGASLPARLRAFGTGSPSA